LKEKEDPLRPYKRSDIILELSQQIDSIKIEHPVRVAIDGADTAGKTTLADELATILQAKGRTVIRASIDGFHNPAEVRHQFNERPIGYYNCSFNYDELISILLQPLGDRDNLKYKTRVFDYRKDQRTETNSIYAPVDAVLLFDGVFLLRKEIKGYWDYSIFVKVSFKTMLLRAIKRDVKLFGSKANVIKRYNKRYIPGQKMYLRNEHPEKTAFVIVVNDVVERPKLRYNKSLELTPGTALV
jgi:uridine kinase